MEEETATRQDQKRAAETPENDDMPPPAKRSCVENARPTKDPVLEPADATNFIPTPSSNATGGRFLRLHLQLLKSLYLNDEKPISKKETDETIQDFQDGSVDDKLWSDIENFLLDRKRVQTLDDKANHYKSIYSEAMDFIQEENEHSKNFEMSMMPPWMAMMDPRFRSWTAHQSPFQQAISTPRNSMWWAGRKASSALGFGGGTPMSTSNPGFFPTPSGRFFGHSSSAGATNVASANEECSPVSALGLVAGLLQQKYFSAIDELEKTTTPLGPLQTEVNQRIQKLEELSNHSVMIEVMASEETQYDARTSLSAATTASRSSLPKSHSNPITTDEKSSPRQTSDEALLGGSGERALENSAVDRISNPGEDAVEYRARIDTKLRLWRLLHSDLVGSEIQH